MRRLLVLLPVLAAFAQTDIPTFRARTRLVEVVVARAKDKPAAGLTKDDFALRDNGKPQTIAFFSLRSIPPAGPAAAVLPSGSVSNRPERQGETPLETTVLLLDQKNISHEYQAFAIQRIVRFIEARRARDRIGICTFGRDHLLRGVQEITSDGDLLIRAAHSLKAQDTTCRTTGTAGMTRHAAEGASAIDLIERATDTRNVLRGISRHLAGVPGRKRVIWITTAFPLINLELGLDFRPDMEIAARALSEANLVLYAVDARGLIGALSGMTAISNAETPGPPAHLPPGLAVRPPPPQGLATMQMVARLTGGLVYFNQSNAIEESIQSALDDGGFVYLLGFYPSEPEDGAVHQLKLRVAKKGISLRYRDSYFAAKTDSPVEPPGLEPLLRDSLDAAQIRLVVKPIPDPARANAWRVGINVDPRDLKLNHENSHRSGAIDISLVLAPSGKIMARTFKIDIPDDQFFGFLLKGIESIESLDTSGSPETLRVLVQDHGTGAAGSVTIPLNRKSS